MNEYFVFDRIRCSVADENDIVLQGFCSEKLFHAADALQIVVSNKDNKKENIPARTEFSKAPLDKKNLFGSGKKVKSVSVIIKTDNIQDDDKILLLYQSNSDEDCQELFSFSKQEADHFGSKLNYCIDSVEADGKNILIKGWAVDCCEVDFRLVKTEQGKEEELPFELNRYTRSDVAESFAELDNTKDIGFVIRIVNNKYKMRLYLKAGERSDQYRINGSKGVSKIPAVNKTKNLISKTIMNTKNYGLKSTWIKIKIRFKTKAAIAASNYNSWIKLTF